MEDTIQEQNELVQFQGRLYSLSNQVEEMQWEIARLVKEHQTGNTTLKALVHHLLHSKSREQTLNYLSECRTQLDVQQENQEQALEHLQECRTQLTVQHDDQRRTLEYLGECRTQLEAQQAQLDDFAKTVKKLSRTQFKANTLNESKEQHINETFALLRELATKREEVNRAQKQEEQDHLSQLQAGARGEFAAGFLPVLDGIEMALSHELAPVEPDEHSSYVEHGLERPGGLFKKWFGDSSESPDPALLAENRRLIQELRELHETTRTWRRGLEIVQDRCLRLFAAEGIEPIPDRGEPFDPHRHVAVDTEISHDAPENTVVKVLRKGYTHHGRILRYSEVVVAKAPQTEQGEHQHDE